MRTLCGFHSKNCSVLPGRQVSRHHFWLGCYFSWKVIKSHFLAPFKMWHKDRRFQAGNNQRTARWWDNGWKKDIAGRLGQIRRDNLALDTLLPLLTQRPTNDERDRFKIWNWGNGKCWLYELTKRFKCVYWQFKLAWGNRYTVHSCESKKWENPSYQGIQWLICVWRRGNP